MLNELLKHCIKILFVQIVNKNDIWGNDGLLFSCLRGTKLEKCRSSACTSFGKG